MMIQEHIPVRSPPNPQNEDGIFNYLHNILKSGLLLRDFQDAIKEGDDARIECIWKFLTLLIKVCGKTNYTLGAIRLHAHLPLCLHLEKPVHYTKCKGWGGAESWDRPSNGAQHQRNQRLDVCSWCLPYFSFCPRIQSSIKCN
mgnify:CR=1 FL=1